MIKGIDVSSWQNKIDYAKVKQAGIAFVILRSGYGQTTEDQMFATHLKGFQEAGIQLHGVYWFMYAKSNVEARANAEKALEIAKKYKLPKECFIWCDVEYDTITNAKKHGVTLGRNEVNLFTVTFCEKIKEGGYRTGIYCNNDYRKNMYTQETLAKYPLWLADYSGAPDVPCLYQQYTRSEKVAGVYPEGSVVDANYYFPENDKKEPVQQVQKVANTLDKGDKGTAVKELQQALILCRYDCGKSGADGDYGPATMEAVKTFQMENGLTADGIYGPKTKEKLMEFRRVVLLYNARK